MNIYALKLSNGKYYVGKSDNTDIRIQQHIDEKGSTWTSLYPFESVLFIKESTSCFDEEKYTKELMMLYGIDNVRGAGYTTIILDPIIKQNLKKEIWGAKDVCIRCGFNGHFIKDCKKRIDVDGHKIVTVKKQVKKKVKKLECEKCQRMGHVSSKCLALTKLDGSPIINPCKKCGKVGHTKNNCLI